MQFENYPSLNDWLQANPRYSVSNEHNLGPNEDRFIRSICKSLSEENPERYYTWFSGIKAYIQAEENPLDSYQQINIFFHLYHFDLQVYASDLGYIAFEIEDGSRFFDLVQLIADKTDLAAYRFLAAWAALNLNQPQLCVNECEKVEQPYASIFTIQGQALLELNQLAEAIETLTIAIKINPDEVLAYFQLAKANLSLGAFNQSWKAAIACHKLAPDDGETNLLLAMIALEIKNDDIKKDAWNKLYQCLPQFDGCGIIVVYLLALAFQQKNRVWAEAVVQNTDWKKMFDDQEFVKDIGGILKHFGENNWFDLSQIVLSEFDQSLTFARSRAHRSQEEA